MPAVAPAAAVPKTRFDLEQLQGAWTSVAGPCEARLLVAGSRFTFEFVGGDIYMGILELAPGPGPQHMDMRIEEGPPGDRGQVALCIYQVEGGVLRWCPFKPGSGRRLAAFPSVDD
ncbi:MAG TPA: hypothetical protein VKE74_34960, partial [Gemmataceae bacterium]|nr:hypothetical protein [Gemmataceae bacterium]